MPRLNIPTWTSTYSGYIDASITWTGLSNVLSTFVGTSLDTKQLSSNPFLSWDFGVDIIATSGPNIGYSNAEALILDVNGNIVGYGDHNNYATTTVSPGTYVFGIDMAPDGRGYTTGNYTIKIRGIADDGAVPWDLGNFGAYRYDPVIISGAFTENDYIDKASFTLATATTIKVHTNIISGGNLTYGVQKSVTSSTTSYSGYVDANGDTIFTLPAGFYVLWLTNSFIHDSGFIQYDATISMVSALGTAGDFKGDGTGDIVLQNNSGQAVLWQMNGTSVTAASVIGPANGSQWSVKALGDFNADGKADLLWGSSSGQAAIWQMNVSTIAAASAVGPANGPNWQIAGTGDLDGDLRSDIVWTNATTGQAAVYFMNGTSIVSAAGIGGANGAGWKVAAVGDLDGDTKADLVWQNSTTGQVSVYEMNGSSLYDAALVGGALGPSWSVMGTGDFNADGRADVVLENSSGQAVIWFMNGTSIGSAVSVGGANGSQWKISEIADLNGDARADLIWNNTSTGQTVAWIMNGGNVVSAAVVGGANGSAWHGLTG